MTNTLHSQNFCLFLNSTIFYYVTFTRFILAEVKTHVKKTHAGWNLTAFSAQKGYDFIKL